MRNPKSGSWERAAVSTQLERRRQRAHDLPPLWDGLVVIWRGWQTVEGHVFICPPPKEPACCKACGSLQPSPSNHGLVALSKGTDRETIERHARPGMVATYRLVAFRCTDCLFDQVWDTDADQWWDLDETDYVDEESVPPEPETLW